MTSEDELSDAWNKLRTAVYGRGATRKISKSVANEFDREYEAWRKAHFSPEPSWTYKWVARYRAMFAKVKKAGGKPKVVLAPTPVEDLGAAMQTMGRNFALGAGLVGTIFVLYKLATSGSRDAG